MVNNQQSNGAEGAELINNQMGQINENEPRGRCGRRDDDARQVLINK